MNLDNNLIESITSINGSEPRPWKILRSIKIFKVILNRWVENFVVLYNLDVFLGHVGDLGGGPVPGVHQHSVVRLVTPARLAPVHLCQPVGGGPGTLIPANDHSPVSPLLVLDHLTNPVLHVGRPHIPGLWTLTKVTVLVPEPEHLHGRALPQGVCEGVKQVLQPGAHQPEAPAPPGRRTQPVVTQLRGLIDHLGYRVSSV